MKNTTTYFLLLPVSLLLCVQALRAERDPVWLMPLYFYDANGDRDTVYFGYDPEASFYIEVADTFLGENWVVIDTSKFNIFLFQYPGCPGNICAEIYTDTVRKVDIRSIPWETGIGFCKGKLPIVMKWVDSLLYSPALPFPDISPRPRARIDVFCTDNETGISCTDDWDFPLTLTDYPAPEIIYPIADSLVFYGSGLYPPSFSISDLLLDLTSHDYWPVSLEENDNSNFNLYPNPFTDELNIESNMVGYKRIELREITGRLIKSYTGYGSTLSLRLNYLNKGIYLLLMYTNSNVFIEKIYKTE